MTLFHLVANIFVVHCQNISVINYFCVENRTQCRFKYVFMSLVINSNATPSHSAPAFSMKMSLRAKNVAKNIPRLYCEQLIVFLAQQVRHFVGASVTAIC